MNRCAAVLAFGCSLACAGAPIRGGYAAPSAPRLDARLLLSFVPGVCLDASEREQRARFSGVDLLRTATGNTVLVEHREGHALLVVQNFHEEGGFLVFELIVGGSRLRRYRIPRTPQLGSLEVSQSFVEVARAGGFSARVTRLDLSCSLLPRATRVSPRVAPR